jgi:hypothetical protein
MATSNNILNGKQLRSLYSVDQAQVQLVPVARHHVQEQQKGNLQ